MGPVNQAALAVKVFDNRTGQLNKIAPIRVGYVSITLLEFRAVNVSTQHARCVLARFVVIATCSFRKCWACDGIDR